MTRIRWAQAARDEFEAIAAWSWRKHPDSTERFLSAFLNHIELLERFPMMGAPVKGHEGVRRLLHTPLHVYYTVDPDARIVELVHIWHRARRPPGS